LVRLAQAIELAPDFPPPNFYRGEYRYYEGDLAGAIEDFDLAINLDPSYAQAYLRRAETLAKGGDLHRAIKDLEFYLDLPMGATRNSGVMRNLSAYWYQLSVQAEQFASRPAAVTE
jgi:lipoprotein NlpI